MVSPDGFIANKSLSTTMASNGMLDSDSEDDLPCGWDERVTLDGKVYYAKWV